MQNKITIVGAGINGLLLAMEFSKMGFAVEIYDKDPVDQLTGPSSLEYQIIRPQYAEANAWGMRIHGALDAWKSVFSELRENYLIMSGVMAVSFERGDWADRIMQSIEVQKLPLRKLSNPKIRNLMPAFNLEHATGGVFADFSGHILAHEMMDHMRKYLRDRGAVIHGQKKVVKVHDTQIWIEGENQPVSADWVVVTSGHKELMPKSFSDINTYRAYFADIQMKTAAQRVYWHFAPNWVDMGGEGNLWGVPRIGPTNDVVRIGAGSLTHKVDGDEMSEMQPIQDRLCDYYRDLILDFDDYKFLQFHTQTYTGYDEGEMKLVREGQTLGMLADSGHGFKFAAQNAKFVAEAFEHESFGIAARRVAGIF